MTEAGLRELGIQRIPVPIPFPQAGGPVNVYLVEDAGGGVLMFDSGLGTAEAEAALEQGLARAGRSFDEVTRIVLSHGHVDHYGAARTVQERAGRPVPVHVHAGDAAKVSEAGRPWRELMPSYVAYLLKLGVPAEVMAQVGRNLGASYMMARRVPQVTLLDERGVFQAKYLALEVHHMPGHTPGLSCLYDRQHRLVLSGDHLLEKVSPNPIIDLGPEGREGHFRPLVAYLASIRRLRDMDVDLVLPGHGPPFADHRRVIDGLLQFYEKRQARVRELLAAGALTAYDVTQALFPWAREGDLFLVVSEAIANLEALEDRGEVGRDLEDGVYRFRLLP